jgi:DNA polymerase-3 subunit gamma/tau
LSLDTLLAGLDILAATKARLRGSSHGQVLVEMAVIRLSRLENLVSLAQLAQLIDANGKVSRPSPGLRPAANASASTEVSVKKNARTSDGVPPSENLRPVPTEPSQGTLALGPETLESIWSLALHKIGGMLGNELAKGSVAISAPNCLVLRFSPRYNKERDYCASATSQQKLEMALQGITGQRVQVRYESAMEDAAVGDEAAPLRPRMQDKRREAARDPLVKRAIEGLNAQLLNADPGFGQTSGAPSPVLLEREEDADDV